MTCGDCFAGIGGMSLGLERAGFTVRWQVERDAFCETILARHWPDVVRRRDIRAVGPGELGWVDLVAAGFPCQDLSDAHTRTRRRGLGGLRSGLWHATARLVATLAPRWVVLENTAAWRRWMPQVRADLAGLGYAALPLVVSAGIVGAPHARPRGFVVAHADGQSEPLGAVDAEMARVCALSGSLRAWPDPPEPLGMADGVSDRMDRLKALGNAVVPPVIEVIGRAILAVDAAP